MRRYLSDNQMGDDEFPDHKRTKKANKLKTVRNHKNTAIKVHKTKEDAFDDWAESLNTDQPDGSVVDESELKHEE